MKYLMQMAIISAVTLAGELLHYFLPLPVPGSVYGMLLLFFCLCIGIIKEAQIKETANLLLILMPAMFVGPSVGIMDNYAQISNNLAAFIAIVLITTVVIMIVTGLVTQAVIKLQKKGGILHE